MGNYSDRLDGMLSPYDYELSSESAKEELIGEIKSMIDIYVEREIKLFKMAVKWHTGEEPQALKASEMVKTYKQKHKPLNW